MLFDAPSGVFAIGKDTSKLIFTYSYLDGCVVALVGLNVVGTIDSTLDLTINPVKIVFSNSENSYTFVFDNNDKLKLSIPSLVRIGTYNYSILSNQLVFSKTSGTITIRADNANNAILFNCASSINDYVNISILPTVNTSDPTSPPYFEVGADVVAKLVDKCGESSKTSVGIDIVIYDDAGAIVYHPKYKVVWTTSDVSSASFTGMDLTNNSYKLQVRCICGDGTIKTSNVVSFSYTSNINVYTVRLDDTYVERSL